MALKTVDSQYQVKHNRFKWFLALLLLIAGIVANFHYNTHPWPFRLLGWLFLLSVTALIVFQTQQGKQALDFARESRLELRKVFWPTRQETIQTTMVVAVMVVVLALFLWAVDGVLMWLIGWLTGQRG